MSIVYHFTIRCDRCSTTFKVDGLHRSLARAREEGWTTRGKDDLCPKCSENYKVFDTMMERCNP